jgi:hypothetical protein
MAWTSSQVGRQWPVGVGVGAQDACQHDRVALVGLGPGDPVPVAVAGHGQRVDGIHRPAGGAQAGHQQPTGGLDGDRDGVGWRVAGLGQQLQQLLVAGQVIPDPPVGQHPALGVDHGDVVVGLGPVNPAEYLHARGPPWLAAGLSR